MTNEKKIVAVILAGGTGKRMESNLPKQFLELGGKPIIMHSALTFEKHPLISEIIVVSYESQIETMKSVIAGLELSKIKNIIPGGETRQGSSFAGIKECSKDTDLVLVHDAFAYHVVDGRHRCLVTGLSSFLVAGRNGVNDDLDLAADT